MESEEKRPDLCQFIDKDPIEIKKRLLEVPLRAMSWDKSGSPTETALVLRRPPLFSTLRIYDTNALWRHDEILRIWKIVSGI